MRIALLTPGFSADESDWCIPALLDLVRELAREHDVHVFTLRYPHRSVVYQVYGATVHALGGATAGGLRRLPLLARALATIGRQHRRAPFDVLHGLWADEPGFLAVTSGRLLGAPSVVSLLGGELVGFADIGYGGQLNLANRWLSGQALRPAGRVTVGSATLAALAVDYVAEERLVTLPLGVDTALFTPQTLRVCGKPEGSGPRLLHVASLSPVKDQATLLQALALVVQELPDVRLRMVGYGPLRDVLAAQIDALDLAAHVSFDGDVAHDLLPDLYRAADLFVLSSRYESQSLVALEAAACGCPVVGTAVGLLPELLGPQQLAPVGDAPALAAAMLRLLRDPAARALAADEAHARVAQRFALRQTVPALVALYQTLCQAP
ncbi:MAG TPA: glycosyltransferase [Anaerolineae bacterium]|nr:glycosyltransferase [Anaerolineae bacterium]